MAIPKLNSCCACTTVKTGSKIIGWYEIIGNVLLIVMFILGIAFVQQAESSADFDDKLSEEKKEELHNAANRVYIIYAIALAVSAFRVILGICLLVGIHKENACLIKTWLYPKIIILVLGLILAFISGVSAIFGAAAGVALELYFMWVVFSYMTELKMT